MGDAQHTGRSNQRGPQRTPAVKWRFQSEGRIRAAPLIDGRGHVIVASLDGKLRALTAEGAPVFELDAGAPISATPVIAGDGTIWVGTEGGRVLTVRHDGQLLARHAVGAPVRAALALAPDGTVLVAADGVHGFTPELTRRFHHPTADRIHSAPAVHPSGLVVFGTVHGQVRAIDLEGRLRWEAKAGAAVEAAPTVIDDGTIVVGNLLGHVVGLAPDGSERFRFEPEGEFGVHAAVAFTRTGMLAVGRDDGGVQVFDRMGHPIAHFQTSAAVRAPIRVDAGGTLYVGSRDDNLYAFSEDGTPRWLYNLGQDIDAPAAIAKDGTLYVGTDHGALYALHESP